MIGVFLYEWLTDMIRKSDAEKIIRKVSLNSARSSGQKINTWVSNIIRNTTRSPTEAGSSTEGHPRMGTSPRKGLDGDV